MLIKTRYLNLPHGCDFLCFLRSFRFDWEDISNTQDSVWPHFQTPWSSSKILRYASYFKLSARCLEMWSNTIFLCLIYYIECVVNWLFLCSHGKTQQIIPGWGNTPRRYFSSCSSCIVTLPASVWCAPHKNSLRNSWLFCFPKDETWQNSKRY